MNIQKHEKYVERKAMGLCVGCGIPLPEGCKSVRCDRCRQIQLDTRAKIKEQEEKEDAEWFMPKPEKKKPNAKLDECAKAAREQGVTYGKWQVQETIKRQKGVK